MARKPFHLLSRTPCFYNIVDFHSTSFSDFPYHDLWDKIYLNEPLLEKPFVLVHSSHFHGCRRALCRCRLVASFMRTYFLVLPGGDGKPENIDGVQPSLFNWPLVTWLRPCPGVGWQPCQPCMPRAYITLVILKCPWRANIPIITLTIGLHIVLGFINVHGRSYLQLIISCPIAPSRERWSPKSAAS